MNTDISRHLLPVSVHVEYAENPETGKTERICCVQCSNGEYLTPNIPFTWCHFIAAAINRQYYKKINPGHYATEPIASLRIPGLPMEKSESNVVGMNKAGQLVFMDNPDYVATIKAAAALGEEIFLSRWTLLPIKSKVIITCLYRINGRKTYNLALLNAWSLDLLYGLNIIKSKGHRQVVSMDGSRIELADQAETIITIREWRGIPGERSQG